MTQNQINREVAKATGETVDLIRRRGFGIVIVPPRPVRKAGDSGVQTQGKRPKPAAMIQSKAA